MLDDSTYLVTWNPAHKPWPELAALAEQTAIGLLADEWWNVSNQSIVPGNRIFLLKQGVEPTGLMGSGRARSYSNDTRPHWDNARAAAGDRVHFIDVDWDVLLNPASESLLPGEAIHTPGLPEQLWNARNSGNAIQAIVIERIKDVWASHVQKVRGFGPYSIPEGDAQEAEFPEGKEAWRLHRSHERHSGLPKHAKATAMKRGETIACTICGFDFFAKYGNVGRDFIECHHTIPVSELKEGMTTRLKDIVLVCSNCHRMLHRRRPWLTIQQLKSLLI